MQKIDHKTNEYLNTLVGELSHQHDVAPISNHNIEDVVDGLSLIVVQPVKTPAKNNLTKQDRAFYLSMAQAYAKADLFSSLE